MALNKSNTSLGMKIVLIFLIIAFVGSFIPFVGGFLFSGGQQTTSQSADPATALDAKYQPNIAALTSRLQSEPTSYTLLVALGNTYFDWAINKQQASQASSVTAGADQPLWVAAKDAYGRAVAVKAGEPPVEIDYSIALYYNGETDKAVARAVKVTEVNPEFAPAWFNLGIFYEALGQPAKAVAGFQKYLKLDPSGKQGNTQYATDAVKRLQGSSTPVTTTP